MIQILREKNKQNIIDFLKSDEKLCYAALMDEELIQLKEGTWEPLPYCTYLRLESNNKLVGYVKFEYITNVCVCYHWYLSSKHWGSGLSNELSDAVDKWFVKSTPIHKIIIQSPQTCKEVLQAAARNGFEVEGVLTGAIYWRGKIENMVLMSKFIKRSKVDGR